MRPVFLSLTIDSQFITPPQGKYFLRKSSYVWYLTDYFLEHAVSYLSIPIKFIVTYSTQQISSPLHNTGKVEWTIENPFPRSIDVFSVEFLRWFWKCLNFPPRAQMCNFKNTMLARTFAQNEKIRLNSHGKF